MKNKHANFTLLTITHMGFYLQLISISKNLYISLHILSLLCSLHYSHIMKNMVHDQGSTFESLLLAINNLDMLLNTTFNRCQAFDY